MLSFLRPFAKATLLIALVESALLFAQAEQHHATVHTFAESIDALSLGLFTDTVHLSIEAFIDGAWHMQPPLEIEKEFDPLLRESNLILFPKPVTQIRIRGPQAYAIHPIRIAREPASFAVAATRNMAKPRILSRRQWGADETLLFQGSSTSRSDENIEDVSSGNMETVVPKRVQDCEDAQRLYPEDFAVAHTAEKDAQGRAYRWTQKFSPSVKLLVVHHTAMQVTGEQRSGVERMRALYRYHANNRGWGDIGYHYVIDEDGQVYEGKAGGDYVVGGHVYCSNVGTVGVALMGNFELELPSQDQMHSLQWLLADLAKRYDIDLQKSVTYHGKTLSPVVGHRELLSTDCPGYFVHESIGQIRANTALGNIDKDIRFPKPYVIKEKTQPKGKTAGSRALASNLTPLSDLTVVGRPGQKQTVLLHYRADRTIARRTRIAPVSWENPSLGLWQELDGRDIRVRKDLLLPTFLKTGETAVIRLTVQFPPDQGTSTFTISPLQYTLKAEGRRIRSPQGPAVPQTYDQTTKDAKGERLQRTVQRSRNSSSASSTASSPRKPLSPVEKTIRIRLGYGADTVTLSSDTAITVNGTPAGTSLRLTGESDVCAFGSQKGILRISSASNVLSIDDWTGGARSYRGTIECRVIDGTLVLINELPLEDYLKGLGEEPDTEPFEKQRAFAVAARSYAAYYMAEANRKFPGMPYDGDDSPARFQLYGGLLFERQNPLWVTAVESTSGLLLMKNGDILKAAYFSSDDGRTRSPSEVGWIVFPHAEVFSAKEDPWCKGLVLRGHGVGMSGCGAKGQALEGKRAEEILRYYYEGAEIKRN